LNFIRGDDRPDSLSPAVQLEEEFEHCGSVAGVHALKTC